MTERARREYAAALRARYSAADKAGRGRILDEYCRTTGCHRKAAIRRLGQWGVVRMTPGRLEEGVEVLLDHAVQHSVLGVAWPVVAGAEGHSGDIDSARERP